MLTNCKAIVSVIGGHKCSKEVEEIAINLGKNIGKSGYILVCGGLSGVMEAAAKGAKQTGATTVGILPGNDKCVANPYIDVAIATGLGMVRNTIVVSAADAVVALAGEKGTLSEIAFALTLEKPVIDLGNWGLPGMIKASSPEEAIQIIEGVIK
ncbi:MAG: TIGR00725 family protein [Candidatus Omnitrophica bacterium]|nr:TIGR00725 family protein [Candidatus Omnitrophota bacterium]